MLTNSPIYASLPAADLERAKRFYAEKLGLTPENLLSFVPLWQRQQILCIPL